MITNSIPYGRQNITEDDILSVIETLKSDYLTQGPKIKEFEIAFAQYDSAVIFMIVGQTKETQTIMNVS